MANRISQAPPQQSKGGGKRSGGDDFAGSYHKSTQCTLCFWQCLIRPTASATSEILERGGKYNIKGQVHDNEVVSTQQAHNHLHESLIDIEVNVVFKVIINICSKAERSWNNYLDRNCFKYSLKFSSKGNFSIMKAKKKHFCNFTHSI